MSRSGYSDDCDGWELIRWRGAVASALRGRRGQAFLREMLAALDALPEKRLIAGYLEDEGAVCAIGAVGKARGVDMAPLEPDDRAAIADVFALPYALTCEIFFVNDEAGLSRETPEERFARVRAWVVKQIDTGETPWRMRKWVAKTSRENSTAMRTRFQTSRCLFCSRETRTLRTSLGIGRSAATLKSLTAIAPRATGRK